MISYPAFGAVLGLSAGLAPGPLLTLVVSETLTHNAGAGIRVAVAPLVTDLPIILLTVFILSHLSGFHNILGAISILGAMVVMTMGIRSVRFKGGNIRSVKVRPNSLMKGAIVNILSPHPYLFWISVGAPALTRAYHESWVLALSFVFTFYAFMVGSKVFLAVLAGKSKQVLSGVRYIYIIKGLGALLIGLSLLLFKEGLGLLNVI